MLRNRLATAVVAVVAGWVRELGVDLVDVSSGGLKTIREQYTKIGQR